MPCATTRPQCLGRLLSPDLQPVVVVDQEDFIATILDPATIRAILRSMGLATEAADRAPPGARGG